MLSYFLLTSLFTLATGMSVNVYKPSMIGGCIGTEYGCCNDTYIPCMDSGCHNCNTSEMMSSINHTSFEHFHNLSGFGYATGYGAFDNLTFYGYLMNLTGIGNITGSSDFRVVSGLQNVTNMTGFSHLDIHGRFSNITAVGFFPNISGFGNLTTVGSFLNNITNYTVKSIVDIFL